MISVIIPCYNSVSFLREAVDSVLMQSGDFELVEVIVVDDQSTDPEIADIYASLRKISNVLVIQNNDRKGVSTARNIGISMATGNWIAFLDADDVLVEGSIQARCEAARLFPDCEWIGGDFAAWDGQRIIENRGLRAWPNLPAEIQRAYELSEPVRLRRPVGEFVNSCLGATGATLVSARLLKEVGPFMPELRRAEDHQLYIRLAALSDFVFVPSLLMHYRRHSDNVTNEDAPPEYWVIKALNKLFQDTTLDEYRPHLHKRLARSHLGNAYYYRSKKKFWLAVYSSIMSIRYKKYKSMAWKCLAASILRYP